MGHNHNSRGSTEKNITISIFLNAIIVAGELTAGILSNSLALISDALHNFGDLISLVLSLVAAKMKFWKANSKKSYGYIRAEIIVAFINSSTLLIIGVYIIYEAVGRLLHPEPVIGKWLIIVAGISFVANALSTYLLHKNSKEDLNAKSAYLHLFYDAINSLVVVIAGILIYFYNWFILDPIFSILIGLFIIKSAWDIILETVNILSEGTPEGITPEDVQKFIESIPDVKEVHHLHIWTLASNFYALSAHVVIKDQMLSKGYLIIDKLEKELEVRFGINHPTFQLEADLTNEQNEVIKISRDSDKKR